MRDRDDLLKLAPRRVEAAAFIAARERAGPYSFGSISDLLAMIATPVRKGKRLIAKTTAPPDHAPSVTKHPKESSPTVQMRREVRDHASCWLESRDPDILEQIVEIARKAKLEPHELLERSLKENVSRKRLSKAIAKLLDPIA